MTVVVACSPSPKMLGRKWECGIGSRRTTTGSAKARLPVPTSPEPSLQDVVNHVEAFTVVVEIVLLCVAVAPTVLVVMSVANSAAVGGATVCCRRCDRRGTAVLVVNYVADCIHAVGLPVACTPRHSSVPLPWLVTAVCRQCSASSVGIVVRSAFDDPLAGCLTTASSEGVVRSPCYSQVWIQRGEELDQLAVLQVHLV